MTKDKKNTLICITGPTASGKTAFAARLASLFNGEIISADSRQVYRNMDIGTGKDLEDYMVDGKQVPYHLIDIVDPGYEYNVFEYQKNFRDVFNSVASRRRQAFLCGGSGMYIEAVLNKYELINVPVNESLRKDLSTKSIEELTEILKSFRKVHNTTDTLNQKRAIRAIEIESYYSTHKKEKTPFPEFDYAIIGIKFDRESRRNRITLRLKERLENGMIEEAQSLLDSGVPHKKLVFYGLEYKYLSWYLNKQISYDEMFNGLNTAIHQFAKRQMTWFRRMEKKGFNIHWLDGHMEMEEKISRSLKILDKYQLKVKGK